MKLYSIQPWIWIWDPSLRKSEAKDKICQLLCVPHGSLNVQASPDNSVHRAVQSLVPKSSSRSLFSHPAYPGSPGRYGNEQPGLKSCPKFCPCQHSVSRKLCSYQDCMSSPPKANAVNLGVFIFMKFLVKCACTVDSPRAERRTVRQGGEMDWPEFGSPKLIRFICFVARCDTIACVDL